MIAVWCGNYGFKRGDPFFMRVVKFGRVYADKEPGQRLSEETFRKELERLRGEAPEGALVLLDQLEHRWKHPACPPALYVLTCTLLAPQEGFVVGEDGRRREKL